MKWPHTSITSTCAHLNIQHLPSADVKLQTMVCVLCMKCDLSNHFQQLGTMGCCNGYATWQYESMPFELLARGPACGGHMPAEGMAAEG